MVNTLLALHTSKLDEQLAGRLHNTLQGVMFAQIAYAEGDRHHPFLEEVVKLLADFYEMTQNHRSALNSINLLLQIQERLFFTGSAPRKEMLPTYAKIASLSTQLGESEKASKYAEMEQVVLEAEEQAEGTSAARKKEIVQELARLYFKQYLIASQAENVAKSVGYIEKQTRCQIELSGEQSTQVCSNLFLIAHLQIKLGKYTEAREQNDRVIQMCEGLKAKFGDDYPIIASKFYLQQAKLAFITRRDQDAKVAVEKGIALAEQVATENQETQQASD